MLSSSKLLQYVFFWMITDVSEEPAYYNLTLCFFSVIE
jgi:hypothetical protein